MRELNIGKRTILNVLLNKYIKIKIKINPNLPILRNLYMALSGRKDARIFDPSRGGMGIKLNTARKIFIKIAPVSI